MLITVILYYWNNECHLLANHLKSKNKCIWKISQGYQVFIESLTMTLHFEVSCLPEHNSKQANQISVLFLLSAL